MLLFTILLAASPLISATTANLVIDKRAPICGTHRNYKDKKAYFEDTTPTLCTVTACGEHCLADSKCLSFAVGKGICLHYTEAV
jgi:hypothetical protein